MNSITPPVTYIFRCNTDVTSLNSGTAVKEVVIYVSDYITKSSLKTHVIFDSIKSIFAKNCEMISGSLPSKEKARQLMTKVVNLLSTKMEMGAPMICMYLLGNPDHYTDHKFVNFYWQSYVLEARRVWCSDGELDADAAKSADKYTLIKQKGKLVGLSPVFDYIYRNKELENMNLYDWVCQCTRVKISTKKAKDGKKLLDQNVLDGSDESDTEAGSPLDKLGKNMFAFTRDHPLHKGHATRVSPSKDTIIPNIVGATLPRRNQGDQEYYCSTM
ncbi:hypothetical protein BD779DRAFT_1455111, partial [Infundibulicybe gibba]